MAPVHRNMVFPRAIATRYPLHGKFLENLKQFSSCLQIAVIVLINGLSWNPHSFIVYTDSAFQACRHAPVLLLCYLLSFSVII